MARFQNQAQLLYNGAVLNSNIAVGEILEPLSVTKTALRTGYSAGDVIPFAVSIQNAGNTALTGLTLTDDLGGYALLAGTTVYPLSYRDGSVSVFQNGAVGTAPTVTAGPPLSFTGISVPAGGNTVLFYEAVATAAAPVTTGGTVTNTATLSGGGIITPLSDTATVTYDNTPDLSITKAVEPIPVTDNDRITYTITVQNYGTTPAAAGPELSLTDTFNPILTDIAATRDGTPLVLNTEYTYNEATGLFTVLPNVIEVPAATVTQDPATGVYTVTPGSTTITVTGTI